MKIEGNTPNLESVAAQQSERATSGRAKTGPAGVAGHGTDRVQVSESAALAASAARAASETPDIRKDLIERMRAKVAAGEVGADAERLADRMIDHLLDS